MTPEAPQILVVDDAPVIRATLREILEHFWKAAEVTEAADVPSALAAFREAPFDLVLLDMNLGLGETGVDFLKQARALRAEARVVLITALMDDHALVQEAEVMGIQGHLRKPLRAEDIRAVVQAAFDGDVTKRTWSGSHSP